MYMSTMYRPRCYLLQATA